DATMPRMRSSDSRCSTVLVVDDEDDIRETIRTILEDEGYEAYGASNGSEALNLLHDIPRPCVILLDLMMPVMDGWKLLEVLKEDDPLATIPVPVVSAARYQGTIKPARFIKKPVSIEL